MRRVEYDRDFLRELDKHRSKTIYARITSLTFQEQPIQTIEGRVTQGSINLDGDSAVRRSCSLTMVAKDIDISNYYWGLNTKFTLEIGVKNFINEHYPDIIWFPQGIYIITSFSTSVSTNSYTISIQGKDKMCLLNGEVGGSITAPTQFDSWEEEDVHGNWNIKKYPIKQIIRDSVHEYGGEPFEKIVINDVDDLGLELLEYRLDEPMFLFRKKNEDTYYNGTFDASTPCIVDGVSSTIGAQDKDKNYLYTYDTLVSTLTDTLEPTIFHFPSDNAEEEAQEYCIAKIEYGDTAGYRLTDLIYPSDLISNVGESLTSMLDKIKNMLGEFEYFYDIDGRFIFQRKKNFVDSVWTPIIDNDHINNEYVDNIALSSSESYVFSGGELISAFNNSPNLNNVRNDYSVWGTRKGVDGAELPIHMRYALDEKPYYYKTYDGRIYTSDKALYDKLYNAKYEEIKNEIMLEVLNYQPTYNSAMKYALASPQKQEDGSWSAGWWDIRDWYNYYKMLTDGKEPNGTMKWYSHNSIEGCTPIKDVASKLPLTSSWVSIDDNTYVWLIIITPAGAANVQHGYGNPNTGGRTCTYYESYYDEETNKVITTKSNPLIEKYFIQPYSGCADTHTYLEFLKNDIEKNNNIVLFYNPNFPNATFDELYQDKVDNAFQDFIDKRKLNYVDWREIIFQMQKDFRKHHREDNFALQIIAQNGDLYPTGMTGYEPYYIDLEGFWRQLYYTEEDFLIQMEKLQKKIDVAKAELSEANNNNDTEAMGIIEAKIQAFTEERDDFESNYKLSYYQKGEELEFWNKTVFESPQNLNFWFDFLDLDGVLNDYSCKAIGQRPKAVNDSNVKSIYFRDTPTIIFATAEEMQTTERKSGYRYFQTSDMESMFSISTQGKSAKDAIDELLYKHSYAIESATITAIPIYYLELNTRVNIYNEDAGINGDYIVSKATIPLTYNGTMSITATKVADPII